MGAAAIGAASFLTDDEKREAVGYGPRVKKDGGGEGGDVAAMTDGAPGAGPGGGGDGANGGAWRNQPRDAEGRWTDMGGGEAQAIQASDKPISQAVGEWTPEKGLVQTVDTSGKAPDRLAPFVLKSDADTVITNQYATTKDKTIMGLWDFPPEFFIARGEKTASFKIDPIGSPLDPANALNAERNQWRSMGYYIMLSSDIISLTQGRAWDMQRLTGPVDQKYVDYATVAIGLHNAAAGVPIRSSLWLQNFYAGFASNFSPTATRSPEYPNLPLRNVLNTQIGYNLYKQLRPKP